MPKRPSRAQHPSSPGSVGAASVDEKPSKNFSTSGGAATEPPAAAALPPHVAALNASSSGTLCHCWPMELDQFLQEAAKTDKSHERTSIELIRQTYPHLSKMVIWDPIVYLGLTGRKRPPHERHDWTKVEDDILRAEYGLCHEESIAAIDKILRLHPTWSRDTVTWRANVLGLTQHRTGATRKWSRPSVQNVLTPIGPVAALRSPIKLCPRRSPPGTCIRRRSK